MFHLGTDIASKRLSPLTPLRSQDGATLLQDLSDRTVPWFAPQHFSIAELDTLFTRCNEGRVNPAGILAEVYAVSKN